MKDKDIKTLETDKQSVFQLGMELLHQQNQHGLKSAGTSSSSLNSTTSSLGGLNVTNISQESLSSLFPDLKHRVR